MSAAVVTKVSLDKRQTAFVEKPNCNGIGVVSGTPEEIGALMASVGIADGCMVIFTTRHAPNFQRAFNAGVKRARRIVEAAGMVAGEPAEYFIDGYRQIDMWTIPVSKGSV
jgi:ribosomal protein S5